jgi:hypothetical protein
MYTHNFLWKYLEGNKNKSLIGYGKFYGGLGIFDISNDLFYLNFIP